MPYDGCIGNILEFYVLSLTIGAIIYKSVQTKLAGLFSQVFEFLWTSLFCHVNIFYGNNIKRKQKLHVCAKKGEKLYEFPKNYKSKSPVNATHSYTLKQISNWSLYKI